MKRFDGFASAICIAMMLFVVVFGSGCSPSAVQIQASTANAIAHAANAELPVLVSHYEKAGFDVLQHVKERGGTEDEARTALAVVEHDWAPFWTAWAALRAAHEVWADALQGHGSLDGALKAIQGAYCQIIFVWPKEVPALPVAPVRCSP